MMMNNIPMNQMAMNPMMMNNQQNFMNGMNIDGTSQDIKNIILQYENKIRELEEIIKQKDLEIISLKQNLNNNIPNINFNNINPMMMDINMNQMNMEMGNLCQHQLEEYQKISITIKSENDKVVVKCLEDDKASILWENLNKEGIALTYNYQPINERLTIKEIGLYDGCIIQVKNQIYTINFNFYGKTIKVSLTEDCPIRMAIIYLFIKINREILILEVLDDKLNYFFIFNGSKLVIDNTPIKDIFMTFSPLVNVLESKTIIG